MAFTAVAVVFQGFHFSLLLSGRCPRTNWLLAEVLLNTTKLGQENNKGSFRGFLACLLQQLWVLLLTTAGVFLLLVWGLLFSVKLCPVLVH